MSKAKLQAAKELIQERQYMAARAVLETIPTDPTAQRWLIKLDEFMPPYWNDVKSIDTRRTPELALPSVQPTRSRGLNPIVAFIAVIAVIAGAIWLISRAQQQRQWEEKRPQAQAALGLFCDLRIRGMDDVSCDQWVNRTLNEDLSRVDKVLTCEWFANISGNILVDDDAARSFVSCLARDGIYLP